ncbi:hypothetical protein niasHT_019438 [Heterodera trifolii]|uniref:Uncharacterized protein n=1 Tax=Heterodera trifolii TaxID=157864 RepID=A0ABD2KVS6_9BILA
MIRPTSKGAEQPSFHQQMAHVEDTFSPFSSHPPDPQHSEVDFETIMLYRFQIPIFINAKRRFEQRMSEFFADGKPHREQSFLDRMAHLAYFEGCEYIQSKWSTNCGDRQQYFELCRVLLEHVMVRHLLYSRQNAANNRWCHRFRSVGKTTLFLFGGMALGSSIGGIVGFGVSLALLQASESASSVALGAAASTACTAGTAASSKLGASAAAGSLVAKALGSAGTKVGLKIGATTGGAVTGGILTLREKLTKLFNKSEVKQPPKTDSGGEQHKNLELPYGKGHFLERMARQFEDEFIYGHLFARGHLPEWERRVAVALRVTETVLVTREGIEEGTEAAEEQ